MSIEVKIYNPRELSPGLTCVEYSTTGEEAGVVGRAVDTFQEQPDGMFQGTVGLTTMYAGMALVGTTDAVIFSGSLPYHLPTRTLEAAIFEAEHTRRRASVENTIPDGPTRDPRTGP